MSKILLFAYVLTFLTTDINCMPNSSPSFEEHTIERKIRSILADFLGCNPNTVSIAQLKDGVINCYNNTDFKITIEEKNYFAKFENPDGKILGTSMQNEVDCATIAHRAGLSPKVLIYDSTNSILVTEFIEIKESFDFNRPMAKQRYVSLLHRLHALDVEFPLQFFPLDTIHLYVKNAVERGVSLPSILFEQILPKVDAFNLEELFLTNVPCHLDAQSMNVLDDGENVYLVDWECAAMSDPFFDLASMSACEEFSDEQMFEMLEFYLNKSPTEEDLRRLYKMRILADLRFCTYCYLQTKVSSTRTALYKRFAEEYLGRIMERLAVHI